MNWWIKLGCKLTGWNSSVLSQCSEASKSQLNKYTSALLILMIVWSITGFCFAQRYIGFPILGCVLVAMVFVTIVIMIERQILLAIHPTKKLASFRIVIAIIMAMVGSTIFDQTMFGKDIDKQMADTIELQTTTLTQKRVGIIDGKLTAINAEKDSLDKLNSILQADINANPWIVQRSVTNSQEKLVVDGRIKTVNNPSVTTNQVANPKQDVVNANNEKIKQLVEQEKEWSKKKLTVEEDTRKECKANVGFLEELEAMVSIITNRWVAGAFYIIFFLLLMSLELFVVTSKMGDKECDYEMAIKGAESVRMAQFNTAFRRVNEQYAYKIMKKIILILILMLVFTLLPIRAHYYNGGGYYSAETTSAKMTFRNDSQYNMTLKIIGIYKGLHSVVSLPAYSSRIVSFTNSATYKLKIKAVNGRHVSYHNAGNFSVTCTKTKISQGQMIFKMSTYGSGLGPSISAKEFESNK